jgi:hypothetical protein
MITTSSIIIEKKLLFAVLPFSEIIEELCCNILYSRNRYLIGTEEENYKLFAPISDVVLKLGYT